MRCWLLGFVALTATAQAPQQDPVSELVQEYQKARRAGRFEQAAARREEARRLLETLPADAPQFQMEVMNVAQMYQSGGFAAQQHAVLEWGLSRAERLGESNPARIAFLNDLSNYWQQQRNLLKAVAYLEKAVAVQDAAPPPTGSRFLMIRGNFGGGDQGYYGYQRLANLYRQLGRPQDAAAILTKARSRLKDDLQLAQSYEQQGQLEEAAAAFRKAAAMNPQQAVNAWQSLASLYTREERFDDAVTAYQQAIAASGASGQDARGQSGWRRQELANALQRAGKTPEADQVYQQILADAPDENRVEFLNAYANHLSSTKRYAQAETALTDYMGSHAGLQGWQETELLNSLANIARQSGDTDRAREYERRMAEKQKAMQPEAQKQDQIGPILQRAQSAASQRNADDAFSLSMQAIGMAADAPNREQIAWSVPNIATTLARNNENAKAGQLFQQLFQIVGSWAAEEMQPLLSLSQSYARFLMMNKDRSGEAMEAIERYEQMLVRAHGPETGSLQEALQLKIEHSRIYNRPEQGIRFAQEYAALEESLSGPTSEQYLQALEQLARAHESNGEALRAAPLWRQAVAIADLVSPPEGGTRAHTRANAALFFARLQQFEEAERQANEAIAIGGQMKPHQDAQFRRQLQQIERMKAATARPVGQIKQQ